MNHISNSGLKIIISVIAFFNLSLCFSNEIYKYIGEDGSVSFSSIAPRNSKILQTVNIKKLINKGSVINGAALQNDKIKAITNKLTKSRIKRNENRKKSNQNYQDEITLIKNQRVEGLKNLTDGKATLSTRISNNKKIKDAISRIIEKQE